MLAKRDSENLRLREQRDQQMSELMERKQKEAIKLTSMQELKSLSESRSVSYALIVLFAFFCSWTHVNLYRSELLYFNRRSRVLGLSLLLMRVALISLPSFFAIKTSMRTTSLTCRNDLSLSYSFVCNSFNFNLFVSFRAAESKAQALDQSLSGLQSTNAEIAQCVKSEADARQQLSESNTRLQAYASMFGDLSNAPADAKAREDELQRLRLQVSQNDQVGLSLNRITPASHTQVRPRLH
jgi:E3 ubiquitin-protein ligase BRE1